jgi:hypothetical protein
MKRRVISAQNTVKALRAEIEEVFSCLDDWCSRSPEILALVPKDVGWSIQLILEHVGIVNRFLMLTLDKGVDLAVRRAERLPIPERESELSILTEIADPDAFDWRPPEHMIPSGKVSLGEVRGVLATQHKVCRRLLEKMAHGEGFLHTVQMSVRDLGRLDMYQWFWFLLMHARRHLAQMERAEVSTRE